MLRIFLQHNEVALPHVLMPISDVRKILDTAVPFSWLPEDGFEVIIAGPEVRAHQHAKGGRESESESPIRIARAQAFTDTDCRSPVARQRPAW